ncbi:MAG TPA: hypothetical protein VFR52_02200 [Sphingomicrobium sp.]|nr:hypothetical protein [Sphingomicrobium sp.]
MAQDPFKEERRRFEEAINQYRAELERAREQGRAAFERARAEMELDRQQARLAFEQAREEFLAMIDKRRIVARGRPPRRPLGGEPAPVVPKPKPTPLQDGAEAPIE